MVRYTDYIAHLLPSFPIIKLRIQLFISMYRKVVHEFSNFIWLKKEMLPTSPNHIGVYQILYRNPNSTYSHCKVLFSNTFKINIGIDIYQRITHLDNSDKQYPIIKLSLHLELFSFVSLGVPFPLICQLLDLFLNICPLLSNCYTFFCDHVNPQAWLVWVRIMFRLGALQCVYHTSQTIETYYSGIVVVYSHKID